MLGILGLTGCGFAPVYGTGSGLRKTIAFDATNSIAGFRLRAQLEDRLGRSTSPLYRLDVGITSHERAAAITSDGETTRLNVLGKAVWTLTDFGTGVQIQAGVVDAMTSYAATGSTIATQSTKDDAEARLAIILADMIVSKLSTLTLGETA